MHKRDKKMIKKVLFWAALFPIEIRTISPIISLKCAELLVLAPIAGLGASKVPINWDQIKEFAQDVQELRQDPLKYGQ